MTATQDATVHVFVRLHAAPGNDERVYDALRTVVAASRAEPGCLAMDAFRSRRDPRRFVIHSVWRDAAAFDEHARLPHTILFMETVDALVDEPRDVTRTLRLE